MTLEALDKLSPENREKNVARWMKRAKPRGAHGGDRRSA